ncbi:pyocin knob domain-containing protein [Aliarcobacter butzleri]|uniref:pyocin knob domain-containing protein n=1 Tax=Aliarcobacter butzleri TaxID=28197 RepID=UPI0024DEE7DD|nr:pyocin knob domain-containing protein [Aliarcobacter butzleri]MDK2050588.1 pyocin knob domain-containing protein [Aliarcobacter butzleri]
MVSKITATIESVPIWGDENFDANVHENFLKLKELGPQLNKTVDEINKTFEDIDTYTKTASNKAGEAAQSASDANKAKQTATQQAEIATTKAGEAAQSASDANKAKQTATQQAEIATTKAGEVNYIKNEMIKVIEALQSDPLSIIASQELAKKLNISDIQDLLTSTDSTKPLSANQGRILKEFIDAINEILSSDDTTLDELQEIVNFIKQNKSTLDSLTIDNIAGLPSALSNKVDKVLGKGLSSNDFTTNEKNKLANIENGAQANVTPTWNSVTEKPEFNENGFSFFKGFKSTNILIQGTNDANLFRGNKAEFTNVGTPTTATYLVFTFSYNNTEGALRIIQIAYGYSVNTLYMRTMNNSTTTAWVEK